MDKKYIEFTDLSSYKLSYDLSNIIWDIVIKWDYFAKDTVGKQFVRAVDSISAIIEQLPKEINTLIKYTNDKLTI